MIRLILVALFLILFFIVGIFSNIYLFILGKINISKRDKTSHKIVRFGFNVILKITGTEKTIIGVENIPTDKPILLVSNHRSYFDILVIHTSTPTDVGFVAKEELDKIPFLGKWMQNIGCIFLDRSDIKKGLKTILLGIERIKNGYSLVIFPEGSRNHTDKLTEFKAGSLKLAEKSGCPIIPVAIKNTDNIWENNSFKRIKPTKVSIEFGKPIEISKLSREEKKLLSNQIQNEIQTMLNH